MRSKWSHKICLIASPKSCTLSPIRPNGWWLYPAFTWIIHPGQLLAPKSNYSLTFETNDIVPYAHFTFLVPLWNSNAYSFKLKFTTGKWYPCSRSWLADSNNLIADDIKIRICLWWFILVDVIENCYETLFSPRTEISL